MAAEQQGAMINEIKFFKRAVKNEIQSLKKNGVPVYRDELYIMFTRSDGSVFSRPAHAMDQEHYRAVYEAYLQNRDAKPMGTPLSEIHGISPSEIATFEDYGLKTIEEVAIASVAHIEVLGERYVSLHKFAQTYLRSRNSTQELIEKQNELEAAQNEILQLRKQLSGVENPTDAQLKSLVETGEIETEQSDETDPRIEPDSEDLDLLPELGEQNPAGFELQPFNPTVRRNEEPVAEGHETAGDDLFK